MSTNTRYNGELILDGTFLNKQLQVGIEEGEVITMSVESIAAENIGAYTYVGNGQTATAAAAAPANNPTLVADDIEIFGFLGTKLVEASAQDTAKQTATKINNLTGLTGVKAYAKTYAALSSASATMQTYSVKINGYSTGNFLISSGDVRMPWMPSTRFLVRPELRLTQRATKLSYSTAMATTLRSRTVRRLPVTTS